MLGRPRPLDDAARAALAAVLANPAWEVLPLTSTDGQIGSLPPGAEVSVTASPTKPIEGTVELATRLQAAGFHAIPHLAARMVRDEAHLRELLARIGDAGISEVFVVGGDAATAGAYPDGLALLRAMTDLGHGLPHVGVPCYPDGHAFIAEPSLLEALRAKAPLATYMTTQLCFDAARIDRWLRSRRADGLALPAVIGLPGAVDAGRLLAIAARIGVRDTRRFVAKNLAVVTRLMRSGGFYRPDALLAGLAPTLADPAVGVSGVHLYTFNQVATTEAWRRAFLDRLAVPDAVA